MLLLFCLFLEQKNKGKKCKNVALKITKSGGFHKNFQLFLSNIFDSFFSHIKIFYLNIDTHIRIRVVFER